MTIKKYIIQNKLVSCDMSTESGQIKAQAYSWLSLSQDTQRQQYREWLHDVDYSHEAFIEYAQNQ